MHIEPGVVDAAKMGFAVATATGAAAWTAKLALTELKRSNPASLAARAAIATVGTFVCFELLPHFVAGVSEVHFILGTTLFLILGAAPAAIGLALGLLLQGMLFAPTDLPMFAVNVTTLLVPLFAMSALGARITQGRAYVDLGYADVAKLSALYQGGVVSWVAFWVFYGQGVGAETMAQVMTFAGAYAVVLLVEPVADLAVLAAAKARRARAGLVSDRLYAA
ncbi:energy-coupling factor ABC transporter permease [Thetidibacter halocola]|uniref:Energy-coupling factor ABC transporter permease n=1 Tax=Thetidibacter halocola TaxID=2827239 RepID=A0A8J8B729_9RHOB|nr:energy-coupling factor ABC transporter permease [Thetidibacter halocola]MBS0123977.1 energy-coupling factor ABC transporter permease [Thetidibacter halocola]